MMVFSFQFSVFSFQLSVGSGKWEVGSELRWGGEVGAGVHA